MTVASRLKSTMASLEGLLADFKSMHEETTDDNSKEIFRGLMIQTEDLVSRFRGRIEEVENEEPQYKGE